MDYHKAPLLFKIKKAIRYLGIYGISRTIAKVKGQYHMKKKYVELPKLNNPDISQKHVGLMGSGNFAFSNIAYYLKKNYGYVIRGVMDIDLERAASLGENYKTVYYTDDAKKIIDDSKIDTVYIVSNHASHAEYAIDCLKKGKVVHIEKPHVVNISQLVRLCSTILETNGKVRLGFNRPDSKLFKIAQNYFNKESGAVMINWFVAGHEISNDHWYFSEKEGGRVLGNLCHWTDLTLQMIPENKRFPIKIIPTRSAKSDCDISVSYVFADNSIGTITFSAKGHTFEGVRETLNAHKGNVLLNLKDFKSLRLDIIDNVVTRNLPFRDHGHEFSITESYKLLKSNNQKSVNYIWNTGYLFLKTKEALEKFETIVIQDYEIEFPKEAAILSQTTTL